MKTSEALTRIENFVVDLLGATPHRIMIVNEIEACRKLITVEKKESKDANISRS